MPENREGQSLESLVDAIAESGDGEDVTIGTILDRFKSRSFGPLLLIPALIAVAPTGMIPGMSVITGTIIILVSLQMMIGREHVWLPDRAERFSMPRRRLLQVIERIRPWAQLIDRYLSMRWEILSGRVGLAGIALVCTLLAASMFPLALLPFAVAAPASAIVFFAVGLTTRDGLVISAGYGVAALAAFLTYYFFTQSS